MRHLAHTLGIALGMTGKRRAFTGPLWVQIGIANPCNHRCIMCWDHPSCVSKENPYPTPGRRKFYEDHPGINPEKGFMEIKMLESLAEDLRGLGTRRIELAGRGEPTLHPGFDLIVEFLKSRGFNVGAVTNGSRLTVERCDHLVRCGLDRLLISLNAGTAGNYPRIHTTATSGEYDRLILCLKDLRHIKRTQGRKNPQVVLSFVISRLNFREAVEMIDRGSEVGADQIVLKYAIPYPGTEFLELSEEEKQGFSRELPALLKRAECYGIDLKVEPPIGDLTADPRLYGKKTETIYSRIPCYVGWYFALITAEGSVSPCCQCLEPVGDLREERFADIWRSRVYSDFREKMKRLPERYGGPVDCACDQCALEKVNTSIYNIMHFYRPVYLHGAQRQFTLLQLLPAVFSGRTVGGARSARRAP